LYKFRELNDLNGNDLNGIYEFFGENITFIFLILFSKLNYKV